MLEPEVDILKRASTYFARENASLTGCADLAVEACCRMMKVSRSAFFAWRHTQVDPTERMLADAELGDLVVKIHEQSFGTNGTRRVIAELRLGLGREVNHKCVERLMRERGLQGSSAAGVDAAAPDHEPPIHGRMISCIASSGLTARTDRGSKTSLSTAPAKAGSTSPWPSTPGRAWSRRVVG